MAQLLTKDDDQAELPQYRDEDTADGGTPRDQSHMEAADTVLSHDDEPDAERLAHDQALRAALGQTLKGKFDNDERRRYQIEDRWLENIRQYHGRYDPQVESDIREAGSCALFLNITRPKTNAYAARVMDMVLPTDDMPWKLEHTPVPETATLGKINSEAQAQGVDPATGAPAPAATPGGAPILERDIAKGVADEATARAELMQDEINDQLEEGGYQGAQRKAIDQMAKLGTGVLLGPIINDQWRVTYVAKPRPGEVGPNGQPVNDYVRTLVPNKDMRPGVQWVDVWNFYPDMSATDPDGMAHFTIQYLVNDAQLKKYSKRFNFDEEPTRLALQGTPFNISTLRWMQTLRDVSETNTYIDSRHRLLRYFGELSAEDVKACGMDPDKMGLSDKIQGQVWMCDGIVLKVELNSLDSGEHPISIAYCDKDEASIFGSGIPEAMRGEQDSANSAWRMIHDNGGLSVGPQVIMKLGQVQPADGDYNIRPRKLWYASNDTLDVRGVFDTFNVDSHQEELSNILNLAIRFADDVTQLPLIMQGDQAPHITQTAQGMSLLYNASTVVLRRTVKFYDDWVTIPMITRFFEWNMQFNPREEIKGDFRCTARGSSTLLDKEQQAQSYQAAMQLAMQPTWQPYTDMEKLYREALKGMKIADIVLPTDKIKENLKAQQEAAAAAAQAGQKPAGPTGPTPEQMKLEQDKIQVARETIASKERIAIAAMASAEKISITDATTRFAGIKATLDHKAQAFNEDLKVKRELGSGVASDFANG